MIDGVKTLIDEVNGNFAKGHILKGDLTLEPCWIAKVGGQFAHGKDIHAAHTDAIAKHQRRMPLEERIEAFINEHPSLDEIYPCKDLFRWHNVLTGSCELGRRQFCQDHAIDLDGAYSVRYFLDVTKTAYGGDVIKKLIETYTIKGE